MTWIERKLYHALAGKWDGDNECAPIDHKTLRFMGESGCEEVVCILNDAFEVGLGWPERWHVLYRRKDFHRIIRWYLWQWAFSEWFGLRRWIWYKLLNRSMTEFTARAAERSEQSSTSLTKGLQI